MIHAAAALDLGEVHRHVSEKRAHVKQMEVSLSWRQLQEAGGARVDGKRAEAVAGESGRDAAKRAPMGCGKMDAACDWG